MDGKRERVEDTTMQQYPSPSAQEGGSDGAVFHPSNNPTPVAEEQQQAQPHHQTHSLPHSTESTQSPVSQGHQHQTQPPPHNSISNAEELQLAAQLSQDLSSIAAIAHQEDAPSTGPHQSTDPQGQRDQHGLDSEPHADVSAQHQSLHDIRQGQHHQHQHQHQLQPAQKTQQTQQATQAHHSQPASAPSPLPAPAPIQKVQPSPPMHIPVAPRPRPQDQHPHSQPSQYAQDHHQPVLAPQMNTLDAHHLAAQYVATATSVDSTPPRKRSKVSRACDECRRKKVKCDAQTETGEEQCSNCRRSNMQCLFSRVPQKRGPSKGYIKELADRINHIEGKLGSGAVRDLMGGIVPPGAEAALVQASLEPGERKRPYSSISGDSITQLAAWTTPERPMQAFETPRAPQSYHPDSLATPASIGRSEAADPKPASAEVVSVPLEAFGVVRDIDENSFTRYMDSIHPYLPFLPSTKAKLVASLAKVPPAISQAFVDAFHLAMGVLTTPTPDLAAVSREIVEWEISRDKPKGPTTLVHMQTLLLAAISTENAGPHPDCPLTTTGFVRKATDLIYSTLGSRPFFTRPPYTSGPKVDSDDEYSLWIRAWWSLVIFDRLSSVAWGSPLSLPIDYVVLLPSHKSILGGNTYYLAGLAEAIGQMSPILHLSPDVWNFEHASTSIVRSGGTAFVDSWRRALPNSVTPTTHPVVHIAYWHSKVISYIISCAPPSNDVVKLRQLQWCVSKLVTSLTESPQLPAPFMHHFASLACLAIGELKKVPEARGEASDLASQLLEANVSVEAWRDSIRHLIEHAKDDADGSIATATAQSAASQGLQHLADLATTGLAAAGDVPEASADGGSALMPPRDIVTDQFNPFFIVEEGYLNVVSRLTPEAPATN
ncbi:uncharacterized protein MKZ38_003820 [Zalerion maritima]|uniref:Zn(2)-C6 fungal-type domain-containing protein n=1 Tax=Zalerion maritima TaxID=339359 RepID=A0AAD5RNM2_9PEZI|nr:uncharacterized protein MKZ38_003820 [Zalerion maritima]